MNVTLCLASGEARVDRCGHTLVIDTNTEGGRQAFATAVAQLRDLVLHRPWRESCDEGFEALPASQLLVTA